MKLNRSAILSLNQEQMVIAISGGLFVLFSIFLNGFFSVSNLLALLQSVSILGVLAIGMAVVVIGRGIDLTMVAVMVFSTGWSFTLFAGGMQVEPALLLGLLLAVSFGAINGFLIAYIEIPAIFATLAMATVISGLGRFALVSSENIFISGDVGWFASLGAGAIAAIPMPVFLFLLISCITFVALRMTRYGAFVYAIGDNPLASRNNGMSVRPMMVLMYSFASLVAFCAGLIMAMTVSSVNTKLATSTMIYDIILIVVIGGIGLSGGKGSIRNVISGTLLIGLLLNGLTIMNVDYSAQNIIKSLILLLAIIVDSLLNPRDEQTSQQGDI